MGLFDPANLNLGTALETRRQPLPAEEVLAQITKIEPASGTVGKGPRTGEAWHKLNYTMEITDAAFLDRAKREGSVQVTYGVMIDLTPAGQLATGPNKNIGLGKLMDAANCNQPGKNPANAPLGQWVKIRIGHRNDPDDPSIVYDEVKGVTKTN